MRKLIGLLLLATSLFTTGILFAASVSVGNLPDGVTGLVPYDIFTGNTNSDNGHPAWKPGALKSISPSDDGTTQRVDIGYPEQAIAVEYGVVMNGRTQYTPAFKSRTDAEAFFHQSNWQTRLHDRLDDPGDAIAKSAGH